ncbi:kinase-like domain-containing protein [Mycena latifolia]|nr:kinase-like domain-containing protein [Mycena latifolia]
MSNPPQELIHVDSSLIPNEAVVFDNWTRSNPLPTPAEVRTASPDFAVPLAIKFRHKVLHFPNLGLVVKYGRDISISEGQTLWVLKKHCPQVRVPEVYGWCQDEEGETFLYMEYLEGRTLESCIETLADEELRAVAVQVALMMRDVRSLRQSPGSDIFVGTVSRGPILDQLWRYCGEEPLGPTAVQMFNDAFAGLARLCPGYPDHEFFRNVRASLSDTAGVRFTHADLHPFNIIISPSSCEVIGIIDWQESGWYPEYWEYIKTSFNFTFTRWYSYVDVVMEEHYKAELEAFHCYESTGMFC